MVVGPGWLSWGGRPKKVEAKVLFIENMDRTGSTIKIGKKRKHKPFPPLP